MRINTSKYHIRFFQVGEASKGGDAIVIELFDEKNAVHIVVIDGGYKETGDDIVDYLTEKYYHDNVPVYVEVVLNTHPDIDHISGLKCILESDKIKVGKLFMNRPWKEAGLKKSDFDDNRITKNSLAERIRNEFNMADGIEEIAQSKKIKILKAFNNCPIDSYQSILYILSPSYTFYKVHLLQSGKTPDNLYSKYNKPYVPTSTDEESYFPSSWKEIEWFDDEQTSDINETSLVIALVLGEFKVLFTGDAGKVALNLALDNWEAMGYHSTDFTVVQLPHHGSRKNIDPAILKRLNASEFIISCPPQGEKEGHPSRRLMNKILEINPNAKIYRTGNASFNFYEGINVNYTAQIPQRVSNSMDGKAK